MIRFVLAFFLAFCGTANAQLSGGLQFPGPGTPHSVATYQGPGDVVASARTWYGLRCYNTAYTGNVADVYAPSDASHTLLTCSSGGVINQTLQALATTCATSCTIKTLYDQSGANQCTGSIPCDLTHATEAQRPTLTISGINSKLTGNFSGSQHLFNAAGVSITSVSQPYTMNAVFKRTSATVGILFGSIGGAGTAIGGWSGADQFAVSSSSFVQVNSITDNTPHSAQFVSVNPDTGSTLNIDGSSTPTAAGTGAFSGTVVAGDDTFSDFWVGQFTEFGIWPSAFNSTQQTNMCNNLKTYYNLSGTC
jgi:hypothetical protein